MKSRPHPSQAKKSLPSLKNAKRETMPHNRHFGRLPGTGHQIAACKFGNNLFRGDHLQTDIIAAAHGLFRVMDIQAGAAVNSGIKHGMPFSTRAIEQRRFRSEKRYRLYTQGYGDMERSAVVGDAGVGYGKERD